MSSQVAPYTGAWIETAREADSRTFTNVAPYTGAWIETSSTPSTGSVLPSHPIRVRGLKHLIIT